MFFFKESSKDLEPVDGKATYSTGGGGIGETNVFIMLICNVQLNDNGIIEFL